MPGPSSQVQVPSSRPESRGGGETKREPGCGGLSSIHCVCPLPVYRRFCLPSVLARAVFTASRRYSFNTGTVCPAALASALVRYAATVSHLRFTLT